MNPRWGAHRISSKLFNVIQINLTTPDHRELILEGKYDEAPGKKGIKSQDFSVTTSILLVVVVILIYRRTKYN